MITGIKAIEAYMKKHPGPWDDVDEDLMDNLEDELCAYNPKNGIFSLTEKGQLYLTKAQGNA